MLNEKTLNAAHWDDSDADIGVYRLIVGEEDVLQFVEADRYYRGCSRKPNCCFVLDMCIWGSSHSHNLTAESVDLAKTECETWLINNLEGRIKGLRESINHFQTSLKLVKQLVHSKRDTRRDLTKTLCLCSCGGKPELIKLFPNKRYDCFVKCEKCGRETKTYTSRQNAINAWNNKVSKE